MRYTQPVLSCNLQIIHFQKIVVLQQTSGNGVLNGHDTYQHRIFICLSKYIAKGTAGNNLQLFAPEIAAGCNLVICTGSTLNSYSYHIISFFITVQKKIPSCDRQDFYLSDMTF